MTRRRRNRMVRRRNRMVMVRMTATMCRTSCLLVAGIESKTKWIISR